MNLQDIKKLENEGWTYRNDFRVATGQGNTLSQFTALERNGYYRIINSKAGRIGKAVKYMSDADIEVMSAYKEEEDTTSELYNIFTFAEACEIWHLSESTLRKTKFDGRFRDGETRQSGGTWLVTNQAMERLYGVPR